MAALFDGQGFFEFGMGKSAHDNYAAAREVFAEASQAVGVDLARVCFGDLSYLQEDTRIVQPAIVTVDLAEYAAYRERHGSPDIVTGMSLGYYAAMGAAEVFQNYGDTVKAVAERARILYELHKERPGVMAGFVGLAKSELDPILKATGARLAITRDKLRHSFVVAGSHEEIENTEAEVRKKGVRRFEILKIFGRFHHDENREAQPLFTEVLESFPLNDPTIRLLGNNAIFLDIATEAARHAVDQLVEPVEWDDVIEILPKEGVTAVAEFGPDKSRGLVRQVSRRFDIETITFPEAV